MQKRIYAKMLGVAVFMAVLFFAQVNLLVVAAVGVVLCLLDPDLRTLAFSRDEGRSGK